jgi:hypothetical protein
VRRFTLENRLCRLRGRLRRSLCILRGRHTAKGGDWGYALAFAGGDRRGMVDRFCPNCMKLVDRVPLDDFEHSGDVLDVIDLARGLR